MLQIITLWQTYVGDFIEGGVSPQTKVCPWDVVTDGTRDHHHRDTERIKLIPGLCHLQGAVERLKQFTGTCRSV